ncbi:MAG: hypothetical protein GWP14_06015 [Actinobacteria bacterium]|nr:hypothetical protein [Actinomycetota bacterium]
MLLKTPITRKQELKSPDVAESMDRRSEPRLRYFWPIWYSSDGSLDVQQGRMVDLCSGGVSFLAPQGDYPEPGDDIWLRSSYPVLEDGSFGMASFTTIGRVLRSEQSTPLQRRIAVRFGTSLEHKPAEVASEAVPALGHSC